MLRTSRRALMLGAVLVLALIVPAAQALTAGQNVTFGSVTLRAGTLQTFGNGATDATVHDVDVNVNLANADALNASTDILFEVDRSLDGGTSWQLDYCVEEFIGGPQNQRFAGGPVAMPGVSFSSDGVPAAWRMRVTSVTRLTTVSEVIATR